MALLLPRDEKKKGNTIPRPMETWHTSWLTHFYFIKIFELLNLLYKQKYATQKKPRTSAMHTIAVATAHQKDWPPNLIDVLSGVDLEKRDFAEDRMTALMAEMYREYALGTGLCSCLEGDRHEQKKKKEKKGKEEKKKENSTKANRVLGTYTWISFNSTMCRPKKKPDEHLTFFSFPKLFFAILWSFVEGELHQALTTEMYGEHAWGTGLCSCLRWQTQSKQTKKNTHPTKANEVL